ncbi:BlaI/MecI/CopY family transcriptional regulator [Candidatus Roizmanbacteria bacterium]|nr:BlaI/MecI/CopY family transcriptional regulator [Candidatus Roizmanbacteria bacterium]
MKTASLGELEKQIMDILWECRQCSARDVLNKLEIDRKLAYTTVATVLQRLYEKGLLTRKEDKLGHIYSSKLSRESYSRNIAQSFLKKFINSFGNTAIASFAESIDKLPSKKREYFLKLLEGYDKSK